LFLLEATVIFIGSIGTDTATPSMISHRILSLDLPLFLLLVCLLAGTAPLRAQSIGDTHAPGSSATAAGRPAAASGISRNPGCHLPAKGAVRGLVLFIQTQNDDLESAEWPLGQLPVWGPRYVSDLQTYFSDMSGGQFQLTLDILPQLLVTQGSEFDYISSSRTLGNATKDLLATLDATFDFAPYDTWQTQGRPYAVIPGPDQFVELIITVYRHITQGRFFNLAGVSDLGFTDFIFVDSGKQLIYGGSGEYNDASASGLTVTRSPGSGAIVDERYAYQVTIHEFLHKLYGESHPALIYGGLGVLANSGGGLSLNSFERHALGYSTFSALPAGTDTSFTLRDYVSTTDAAALPIPQAPNWYYTFEYRTKQSRHDSSPAKGVYMYRVYDPESRSQKEVHPVNAGGNWQWAVDSASGTPFRRTPDPLDGFNPYDKVVIDGKPFYVDGWAGDPHSPFTLEHNAFTVWSNPTTDFRFNRDTVHTNLYIYVTGMTDSTATIEIHHHPPAILRIDGTAPADIALQPAFPNPVTPSSPTASIPFELAAACDVRVDAFDALGRVVASLADGPRAAGTHTLQFQTSALTSGIYRVVLRAGSVVRTQSLVVTR
jgi:hypothetical protein